MKCTLSVLAALLVFSCCHSQDLIEPGGKGFNEAWFKPRSIFQKLTWLDKDGKMLGMATLHCITRIDSSAGRLVYLQIRNDGKKDSTITEWPSLRPLYTASFAGGRTEVYDHRAQDTCHCFDDFMGDYLMGSLPLKPGYHGQFFVCGHDKVTVLIKDVRRDVLTSGNGQPLAVNLVMVNYNGFDTMYWIDPANGEILKFIFTSKDGSVFMKSKI